MSRETSISVQIHNAPEDIVSVIKAFQQIGWEFRPEIEYLPLHDEDASNWQKEKLSPEELFALIDEKQRNQETIGLILYYHNTEIGIMLLLWQSEQIDILPDINRKTLKNSDITDISFYLERTVVKLEEFGYVFTQIDICETI